MQSISEGCRARYPPDLPARDRVSCHCDFIDYRTIAYQRSSAILQIPLSFCRMLLNVKQQTLDAVSYSIVQILVNVFRVISTCSLYVIGT